MSYSKRSSNCCHCNSSISYQVYSFSNSNFDLPLCIPCQHDFKERASKATPLAIALYKELKKRGVPAELEKWDGHKTIDIAVVDTKVNIDVDGGQHNYNARQALSDLKRTLFAFKQGFLTLRIPNSLVQSDLEETANLITEILVESREQREINEGLDDDWDDFVFDGEL